MDPTCGLADKLRDLAFDLFWEQLLCMIYYGQNIKQLNEQLEKLTLRRSSLQHQVDEAVSNVEKIEEEVLHWFNKVDEISERVQELQKQSQAKRGCSMTSCPNPWLRYKLSKRAKEIAEEAESCGKGKFDRVSYRAHHQLKPESTNRESIEGIESRVPIMNQLREALRNPSVNMIGLCGFGGVGKTTIARELEKNQKNEKMFEKVIMATVSKELNVEKIQSQIAEKLGMQLDQRTEDVRAARLCERLKQEKSMLLILDDLWEEVDLCEVGIPITYDGNYIKKNEGCKVLLTSRDERLLLNSMKCQKIIKVGFLSEKEALELFMRIAELSTDLSSDEFINIASQIVQKFQGLPLGIATAAKTLRGEKDLNVWKYFLQNLKNPLGRNITGIKEVDSTLKWSYDHLSSLEYKHIFLLAAMLSHDPSVEDLLMYSIGLDILTHAETMEDAQIGIYAIISKLKSLNLFIDSFSSRHVTIHDVVRDFALPIASHEFRPFICRKLKKWPDENMLEGCKKICLQESDMTDLPEELHVPNLVFFLLSSTKRDLNIPNMFFKSSKELKVLALTNVKFSSLSSLIFLQKLKALCLHSCLLEDMAEVSSLKSLKVLSLAYSEIERLPIELAELTSLQMLNLSHCSNLKVIPQKLLSSLKKLEILYMENSFHQWRVEGCSEANENASLDELKDLPISALDIQIPNESMLPDNLFLDMNLKRYNICIGSHWEWQESYETSKMLKLKLQSSIHLKRGVQKLLEEVEDLYLYGNSAYENILQNHGGKGFHRLRRLHIDHHYDIGSNISSSAYHEAATKNVPDKISKSLFSKEVLLPELEILKLSNLLNTLIPLIWDDKISLNLFSNLRTLIVASCGFVKVVPFHVMKSFNNLEELEVRHCYMLEIVFDFEDLNDHKEVMELSSLIVVPLKKLKLENLPKLKDVWRSHCQGNVSFPSLRSIDVSGCKSLTNIFPASIGKNMLRDLERLKIESCSSIDVIVAVAEDRVSESIPPTFEFPRLTSLQLFNLPKLKNFYSKRHTLECPHLQLASIRQCEELEIFAKEVLSSSEIYCEEESTINSKYPLFCQDKVMHNLEDLSLEGKQAEMMGSGQFALYNFPKVKMLQLYAQNAKTILYTTLLKSFPNLDELKLSGRFEEAFERDDVATLTCPFPKLKLDNIYFTGSLSPFSFSAPNLTQLEVMYSHELISLMTSSTARSLVNLTRLSISHCRNIKEIIMKQEEEDDEDKEIILNKLKILVLDYLYSLKRFCGSNYTVRFPILNQLVIKQCPAFRMFSPGLIDTPSLKSIQVSSPDGEKQQEILDADLNKAWYQQRFMASKQVELDNDDAAMIRNDQFPTDGCPQVETLRIRNFVEEWITFPYTLLERFPNLKELHLSNSSFKEIFPSHAPSVTSFENLTVLEVFGCHQLVYLMTTSTAKSLMNLETLEISYCHKLEEIIRKDPNEGVKGGIIFNGLRTLRLEGLPRLKTEQDKRDFNIEDKTTNAGGCSTNVLKSLFSHKVLLPKLETLILVNLSNNLISLIWDDQLQYNSFSNLKTLIVAWCKFVKFMPFRVLKSLSTLETLEVRFCEKLEMMFDFEDLNDYHNELESSSMVVPLNLTHLTIEHCEQIEEIIIKQEGEDDEKKEFFFNKLKLLELDELPRLKRFGGNNYTWRFPLLEQVTITSCPRLTMFCPGAIHAPLLQGVRVARWPDKHIWMTNLNNTIQNLLTFEEVVSTTETMILSAKNMTMTTRNVFPKVTSLYVESFEDEVATFPYSSLQIFPNLDDLHVKYSSFEEIFPSSQDQIADLMGQIPQISSLEVAFLDKLKSIWKDDTQLPPIHQNLEVLKVKSCCNLVKLAPSSASFQNLSWLCVFGCQHLNHLVTTSIAKSLVSLVHLEVNDCKRMVEIVMNDTNEDVQQGGITFNRLGSIKLNDMPSLKMFSSQNHTFEFPTLQEIEISGCPAMKMFCPGELKTPMLSEAKIEDHDMEWKDGEDLNKTMKALSSKKDSINA